MGELLLCNRQIGAMPYYIEGISLNVYSIEELCYYIANNVYLLDSEFMNEELCNWLERELKYHSLADDLREILHGEKKLSNFVELILTESYYLTPDQIDEVISVLSQMEEKSEFECDKMRADRLIEKEKYLSSIYAYKHLLNSEDAKTADPVILGNIYHNLGTAYARLFMFQEAADFYREAYQRNADPETLREWLFAYRCMRDEEGFTQVALENHLSDTEMEELKNELSLYSRSDQIKEFEENLGLYRDQINKGDRADFARELDRKLTEWKNDYRRICRI